MKLVCKLEKVVDTVTTKGTSDRFEFVPVKNPYDNYMKLVISGDNSIEVMTNLGFPFRQGDTIEIDFSPKQSQAKLVKK